MQLILALELHIKQNYTHKKMQNRQAAFNNVFYSTTGRSL